jgi:LysR family hydrogen peroxide-inducible transcriptional activator
MDGAHPATARIDRGNSLSTLVQLVAGGLGVPLLPRTAVRVETGRSADLATAYFCHSAPERRVALAMRQGAARAEEFEAFASALREAPRPLPVRFAC